MINREKRIRTLITSFVYRNRRKHSIFALTKSKFLLTHSFVRSSIIEETGRRMIIPHNAVYTHTYILTVNICNSFFICLFVLLTSNESIIIQRVTQSENEKNRKIKKLWRHKHLKITCPQISVWGLNSIYKRLRQYVAITDSFKARKPWHIHLRVVPSRQI